MPQGYLAFTVYRDDGDWNEVLHDKHFTGCVISPSEPLSLPFSLLSYFFFFCLHTYNKVLSFLSPILVPVTRRFHLAKPWWCTL